MVFNLNGLDEVHEALPNMPVIALKDFDECAMCVVVYLHIVVCCSLRFALQRLAYARL